MEKAPLKLTQSVNLLHQHRLAHRVKIANFISLPEVSFSSLVQQVENDPLFLHYRSVANQERIFRYQRYPRTGMSSGFFEMNENTLSVPAPNITEEFLSEKQEIIELCQRIGMENFKDYFLYHEGNFSLEDISARCKLSMESTKKIMGLVDRLALEEEFHRNGKNAEPGNIERYSKIANIEKDSAGNFTVTYTSLRYGRGRYVIDHEKFETLKNSKNASKEEIHYLENMIKTLELINTRK